MFSSTLLPTLVFLTGANLFLIGGAFYNLRGHHIYNLDEHETYMDELEGTLREHVGVVEESLNRIESIATEEDGGKLIDKPYMARGSDEKKDKEKSLSHDPNQCHHYSTDFLLPLKAFHLETFLDSSSSVLASSSIHHNLPLLTSPNHLSLPSCSTALVHLVPSLCSTASGARVFEHG